MAASLFFDFRARPLSIGGAIMPRARLYFYVTATLTPAPVYADAGLTTPLGTMVEADADGHFRAIYLDGNVTYRCRLTDEFDVLQPDGDVDPLAPPRDYPTGTVVWFHGTAVARDAAYPPALWQVCDGTNGSPDLRDRVPIGAGATYNSGDGGGSAAVVSGAAGGHNHGGTVAPTVLSAANMPVHSHRLYVRLSATLRGNTRGFGFANTAGLEGQDIADAPFGYSTTAPAAGGNPHVEATGSGSPTGHDHVIAAVADHTHTVATLPPFRALWALYRR